MRGTVRTSRFPPTPRPVGRAARIAAAIVCAACGSSTEPPPTEPPPPLTAQTDHYTFHFAEGDLPDTAWQERYYSWMLTALDVQVTERLDYFKYRNREHLLTATGRVTNGFAEPGTTRFHTIWPRDNHEGVHTVVILRIGHPPALFNEGIAVAHHMDPVAGVLTPRWNGQDLHVLARQFDAAGTLPPLGSLLRSQDFFGFNTEITYPASGSFVRYLIDTHGIATLKQVIGPATFNDDAATTRARFQSAYGRSLDQAWEEWRGWLPR